MPTARTAKKSFETLESHMKQAVIPPSLRIGDSVGVVAPAGPVNPEKLQRGVAILAQRFAVVMADSLTRASMRPVHRYLHAIDQVRIDEMNAMIRNPNIRAIMMARGGYGMMRILPHLDAAALRADPKPIVGFSDGTALLAWAWHAGVRGIHGPVVQQFEDVRQSDVAALFDLLTTKHALGRVDWQLQSTTDAMPTTGRLFGGNANLLSHLIATPWQMPAADSLWFIEDVGEKPYAIDRYLTHLQLAHAMRGVHGVIAGEFTRCMDPFPAAGAADDPTETMAVIAERLGAVDIPLWTGGQFGHGTMNAPIPFGARADIDVDGTLTITEPAVA
jgi:muramoyltetrapeptide carboxypeptidase